MTDSSASPPSKVSPFRFKRRAGLRLDAPRKFEAFLASCACQSSASSYHLSGPCTVHGAGSNHSSQPTAYGGG
ncbi:MAG: DUF1010 domain-containing protein [Burkholderiales bacterium]|nr:DUF1010 domain-containing protein [Burkholderiales bacterium]